MRSLGKGFIPSRQAGRLPHKPPTWSGCCAGGTPAQQPLPEEIKGQGHLLGASVAAPRLRAPGEFGLSAEGSTAIRPDGYTATRPPPHQQKPISCRRGIYAALFRRTLPLQRGRDISRPYNTKPKRRWVHRGRDAPNLPIGAKQIGFVGGGVYPLPAGGTPAPCGAGVSPARIASTEDVRAGRPHHNITPGLVVSGGVG